MPTPTASVPTGARRTSCAASPVRWPRSVIAPRRFNPSGEAWLPVLHTTRGSRHYTALYSNTPRAHRLGTSRDWVVLYYDGGRGERQSTVITSRWGPLAGRRIVRGREAECVGGADKPEPAVALAGVAREEPP